MLLIIGFPDVVGEFADFFRRVFSWNQFRRFNHYLSSLITGRKHTIRSMASRLVDHVDPSGLNRFLTLYEWNEELNLRRLEMLQSMKEMRWQREGVVVIDDTLLPKTGGRFLELEGFGTPTPSPMSTPNASSQAIVWT
jgi:hypothetical protein